MMRTREEVACLSLEEKLQFLRSCSTAFAVDAMNLLKLKRWWLDGLRPLKLGQTMAAPASTFRLERLRKGEPTRNAYDALELCDAGTVMCIANIHDTFRIGGNVVKFAENKGISGIVIEACNRDTREMREFDIPVYSLDEVIYQLEMIKAVEDQAAEALRDKTYASPRQFFDEIITKKKHCRV